MPVTQSANFLDLALPQERRRPWRGDHGDDLADDFQVDGAGQAHRLLEARLRVA